MLLPPLQAGEKDAHIRDNKRFELIGNSVTVQVGAMTVQVAATPLGGLKVPQRAGAGQAALMSGGASLDQ